MKNYLGQKSKYYKRAKKKSMSIMSVLSFEKYEFSKFLKTLNMYVSTSLKTNAETHDLNNLLEKN